MKSKKIILVLVAGLSFDLSGCQTLTRISQWESVHFGRSHGVMVTAAPTAADAADPVAAGHDTAETELYQRAVAAIDRRDYALALDVLQIARDAKADDPRVLTAMGVVYDKLGRFDLSKRYYDLAEAADPGSKVVAIDRAYSRVLQQRMDAESAPETVVLASGPALTTLVDAAPAVALLNIAPNTLARAAARPHVRIENATGRPDGADLLRARLTQRGWSVNRTILTASSVSRFSLVRFPPAAQPQASALVRTLPFGAKMVSCPACAALEVLVGTDAGHGEKAARAGEGGRG